ncbi:MAG TPA: hypothetical protein VFB99_22050, partial [Vicinamibacterales bacterium]|nr:hypothetical protein [Vicinamibacterales bacterium]
SVYGFYPPSPLAATLRTRLSIAASDIIDYGGERAILETWYFRNGVQQTVQNQLIVWDPIEVIDETIRLAYIVNGQEQSSFPSNLDGQLRVESHARMDWWNCGPWGEPYCYWTVAGPGDGTHDHDEGPIDP